MQGAILSVEGQFDEINALKGLKSPEEAQGKIISELFPQLQSKTSAYDNFCVCFDKEQKVHVQSSGVAGKDDQMAYIISGVGQRQLIHNVADYRVFGEEPLGMGLCGSVRRAKHIQLDFKVAIKSLERKQFEELELEWPSTEAKMMQKIRHPRIVELYDLFVKDDVEFVVMELVDGVELLSYLEDKGALSEDHARLFFRDLCGAVLYLHRMEICHRDLVKFFSLCFFRVPFFDFLIFEET
jgi:hypothetical protein